MEGYEELKGRIVRLEAMQRLLMRLVALHTGLSVHEVDRIITGQLLTELL